VLQRRSTRRHEAGVREAFDGFAGSAASLTSGEEETRNLLKGNSSVLVGGGEQGRAIVRFVHAEVPQLPVRIRRSRDPVATDGFPPRAIGLGIRPNTDSPLVASPALSPGQSITLQRAPWQPPPADRLLAIVQGGSGSPSSRGSSAAYQAPLTRQASLQLRQRRIARGEVAGARAGKAPAPAS